MSLQAQLQALSTDLAGKVPAEIAAIRTTNRSETLCTEHESATV